MVTLTIPSQPPIDADEDHPDHRPGRDEGGDVPDRVARAVRRAGSVKVDVDPVQGETNTANNTAEYPVIFSLQL